VKFDAINFKTLIMKNLKLLFGCLVLTIFTNLSDGQDYYIYVSDAGGFNVPPWQVLRYNLDGSNPVVLVDNEFFTSNGIGWPQDILYLESENAILISCLVGNRITKHNAANGAYIEDFATVSGGPTRMKYGPDGKIYVLQWSNTINKVLRFETDGTPLGEYTDTGIPSSIGLDWDDAGNLYVSSYGGSKVHQFDASGNYVGEFINTNLAGPTNVHRESDGNYLVLNWNAGNVQRFDMNGMHLETFTTAVAQPEGIAEHPLNNNYLIGNGANGSVDQFQPDGTFVESTIPSGSGGLVQPNAVVVVDASLSIEEFSNKKVLVTPTMGTLFKLNELENTALDSLEVFNAVGQKVATLDINANFWNAQFLDEGLYFLVGSSNKGTYIQKIVIKK